MLAVLGDNQLSDIGVEVFGADPAIIARRDKTPADEGDKDQTRNRGHAAHGGKVEHLERLAEAFLADGGDDDIGRGADEGHHPAKDCGKAE